VTFDLVVDDGATSTTYNISLNDPGNLANSGEILALITAQLPPEVVASVNSPGSTDGLITFTDTDPSTINSLAIIGSTLQSFTSDNSEITVAGWNPGSGASIASFDLDFTGTTQHGSPFAVNGSSQDGFATGRLVGVDIDDTGAVQARFSNGQSQVLGGVALANFNNDQGLTPIGDNAWTESFDSGSPIIGSPGTSSLGLIQSGALEDSNVDLSDELVGLILAQRNFQANAKTIETADALTQTIINIR
jgi:flagellar hook-basal body protein